MTRKNASFRFVPPVIISNYVDEVDESGVILKTLAGIDGTLVGGCVDTDKLPEGTKNVRFTINVINRDGSGKSEIISTNKGKGEAEAEIPVQARSKISVLSDCVGAEGTWITLAIRPNIKSKFIEKVEDDESGVSVPTRTKATARRY
jgi:hypothetical protein